jgi:hypothetical protein
MIEILNKCLSEWEEMKTIVNIQFGNEHDRGQQVQQVSIEIDWHIRAVIETKVN